MVPAPAGLTGGVCPPAGQTPAANADGASDAFVDLLKELTANIGAPVQTPSAGRPQPTGRPQPAQALMDAQAPALDSGDEDTDGDAAAMMIAMAPVVLPPTIVPPPIAPPAADTTARTPTATPNLPAALRDLPAAVKDNASARAAAANDGEVDMPAQQPAASATPAAQQSGPKFAVDPGPQLHVADEKPGAEQAGAALKSAEQGSAVSAARDIAPHATVREPAQSTPAAPQTTSVAPAGPQNPAADAGTSRRDADSTGTSRRSFDAALPKSASPAPQSNAPLFQMVADVRSLIANGAGAVTLSGASPLTGGTLGSHETSELPQQIVQAMRLQWNNGVGDARISLRPDYLGDLSIAIRVERGDVTATLTASQPEVRQWIESHEATLRQMLSDRGLQLDE